MNTKVYKIWLMLLDSPGEWFYAEDIAYQMDVTRKQLYALLIKFPTPPVEKERLDQHSGLKVRITGSEQYLAKVRESVMRDMYAITDEVTDNVRRALPEAGWVTLTDLSAETGYTITQLSKALSFMDDAVMTNQHGVPMYRKVESVRASLRDRRGHTQLLRRRGPGQVHGGIQL